MMQLVYSTEDITVPRGGFRPGAGRPKGSGKIAPGSVRPCASDLIRARRTAQQYLDDLLNDETADSQRRDRAAQVLLSVQARAPVAAGKQSFVPPAGRKELEQLKAKWAGFGGVWWDLLRSEEERLRLEQELEQDPELKAWVLAEAEKSRAAERDMGGS